MQELNCSTPVMVVTRAHDTSRRGEAMKVGAIDYVRDPVGSPEIMRMINAHLRLEGREGATL